jgi:hypothetical protein
MSGKLTVTAIVCDGGEAREIRARGQEAKALLALVEAGPRGVTALECGAWAFRLAAYAQSLRKRFGLAIATEREAHPAAGTAGMCSCPKSKFFRSKGESNVGARRRTTGPADQASAASSAFPHRNPE